MALAMFSMSELFHTISIMVQAQYIVAHKARASGQIVKVSMEAGSNNSVFQSRIGAFWCRTGPTGILILTTRWEKERSIEGTPEGIMIVPAAIVCSIEVVSLSSKLCTILLSN